MEVQMFLNMGINGFRDLAHGNFVQGGKWTALGGDYEIYSMVFKMVLLFLPIVFFVLGENPFSRVGGCCGSRARLP